MMLGSDGASVLLPRSEKSYSMFQVYTQSKLANAMLTCELQRRLAARGSKVCANVLVSLLRPSHSRPGGNDSTRLRLL
jgi:NAD(P)-dependent dehydrogenase (short-subunit alcohol dehydrogenase family)|eukprot:COSAG02_NODE_6407_length_3594_cov_1.077825_6_plen_78_part_00